MKKYYDTSFQNFRHRMIKPVHAIIETTNKIKDKVMRVYDKNEKAPHILNASSNLLGLCFVVLTSLRFLKLSQRAIIDKTDIIAIFFFMLSCILSFLSIRGSIKKDGVFEFLADLLFIGGIMTVFVTAILIVFNIIG